MEMAALTAATLLLCWMSTAQAVSRKVLTPADTFPVEATHFSQVSFPHRTGHILSPLQQTHILDDVQQHRFQPATLQTQQLSGEPVLYAQTQFFGNPSQQSRDTGNGFQVELQKSITDSDQIKQQLEQERLRELKALEEARLAQEALNKAYQQTTTESQKQPSSLPAASEKNFGDRSEPNPSTEQVLKSFANISTAALGGLRVHQPRAMTRFRFVEDRRPAPTTTNSIRQDSHTSSDERLQFQQSQSIRNNANQDLRANNFRPLSEKEQQKQLKDQLKNQFRGQLIQRQELLKRLKQAVAEPVTQSTSQQTPGPAVLPAANGSFPLILADGQNLQFIQGLGGNIPFQLANGGNFDIKTIVLPATEATPTPPPKQPKILFEDLTKGVLPPGAEFEVIRQKQDGGLEEVGKIPQDLPEKKVTFVFLEEQPDGTVKVQGVRGNSDSGSEDAKPPVIDVDSIIKKLQEGNLKPAPTARIPPTPQESQLAGTNTPGNSAQESINSPAFVAQASSNSLGPPTTAANIYQTTPHPQTRSPSVSYFATTNNILPPGNPQIQHSTHPPVSTPAENHRPQHTPQAAPAVHSQQVPSMQTFASNAPVYNQGTAGSFTGQPADVVYNHNPPAASQVHDQQVPRLHQGPTATQQPLFNGHSQYIPSQTPLPQYTTAYFPSNHQTADAFPTRSNNQQFLPTVPSVNSIPPGANRISPAPPAGPTISHMPSYSSSHEPPGNFVGHKDVDSSAKKRQRNRFRATHTTTTTTTTALPELEEDEIKVEPRPHSVHSLTQIMKEEGLFAMARFLRESGLDDILNDTGPYTMFVPTDKAFRSLLVQLGGPEKADEKFKENPRLLSGLLLHHVIPGSFPLDSLQDEMTGVSLAGTQLRVNTYTSQDVEWNNVKVVAINGARISREKHDIDIPQGVAHAVDRVMFPLPVGSLLQTLQTDREHRFSKFLKVLHAADLTSLLAGSKVHTLFAPTDRAFSIVSAGDFERILADKELSQALVFRHLSPGTLYTAGMRFFQIRDTLEQGQTVTINKTGGQVKVNNAKVVTHNIPTTNGVVHVIDGLL